MVARNRSRNSGKENLKKWSKMKRLFAQSANIVI